ncbi:FMN-binding negative transcriptional regulator [Alicyclobacillus vulcanalis]|uniref:Negative transcriptional regulator, PaiB family n=1 Tax=Alicyclobacillus vulcanalis TaxID=252246 RepID=A0A1N7N8L2_9BACL|nr:FMN-binding negative transcriptional regulator [Alicyclobacillus vulcanalis]SIS94717.1 negative transcriptional regulator, PaiB family [Alicyclobacillus vulcanalis]
MYIPKSFQLRDPDIIETLLREHSFATLVTQQGGDICASHVPLVYRPDEGALYGHLAKANPQAEHLRDGRCLAIFQGPHAYVSPSWYGMEEQVPTWNYLAVHVYGRAHLVQESEAVADLLHLLLVAYEPQSRLPADRDRAYYRNLMRGIVAFRIDIERMEAAAKLSQNKPMEARRRVAATLASMDDEGARGVARWMQQLSVNDANLSFSPSKEERSHGT